MSNITFKSGSVLGEEIMRISVEGFWVNPAIPMDEVAQRVLAAVNAQTEHMVQAAVAAEREACAKVCEEWGAWNDVAQGCAEAIRARGQA